MLKTLLILFAIMAIINIPVLVVYYKGSNEAYGMLDIINMVSMAQIGEYRQGCEHGRMTVTQYSQ
jgi:hypothetical protein